jgi:hemerythrin-like domain-containing protein
MHAKKTNLTDARPKPLLDWVRGLHPLKASFWRDAIMRDNRREFLRAASAVAGVAGVGLIAWADVGGAGDEKTRDQAKEKKGKDGRGEEPEEISAPEDLMREHGVLNRVLLIYEEGLRRLRANEECPPEVFQRTANLVRRFVEDYHERLEERFIFPAFERQRRHADLVGVLRRQHDAGRQLTDVILRAAATDQFRHADRRAELTQACTSFIRMYRPHEAREDTVLFPALRSVISAHEVRELGERFEEEENRLFGEEGFEHTVEQVATIERQLGIYELDQFTPRRETR